MDDNKMFGRRMAYNYKKRCELCGKAVHNGYVVNDTNFRGFFCSAPHARNAYQDMQETAKKEGMEIEQ